MYKSNQHFVLWKTSSESSHKVIHCISDNLSCEIYTHTENLRSDAKTIHIYYKHALS